ncbi:MAG: hypothetical protein WDN30_14715 [Pararobbsia sp.]
MGEADGDVMTKTALTLEEAGKISREKENSACTGQPEVHALGNEATDVSKMGDAPDGLDEAVDFRTQGGFLTSSHGLAADSAPLEKSHEAPLPSVILSQHGQADCGDPDTMRFTYQFQSWQGQPVAVVTLGQWERGRRLQVEASDPAMFRALVGHRDALAGVVHVHDGERHSRSEDGAWQGEENE